MRITEPESNRYQNILDTLHILSHANVDCDINIPTIPTCTRYSGSNSAVQGFLKRVRPVGWLEELSKLEDMRSVSNSPHMIGAETWQVKMRMINRDSVLPRQVGQ